LSRKFPDEPRSCAAAVPAGIPADKSKAETKIVADAREKSVQGRVRVIGKVEARWMFFRACLVPKTGPQVSEIYAGFADRSGCVA
jgi:hypothetical protein